MKPLPQTLTTAALILGACSGTAFAQDDRPGVTAPQLSLPYAEQKYRGNIGTTYLDSDPAQFPKQVAAPEGAPNVLVVLLDDVGFGQFSVSGGGVPAPHMEALADKGGTITLSVDGQQGGTGKVERTTPMKFSLSENQDIGTDTGTPVTYDYRTPFDFEGDLEKVVVETR